jgi:hypothetical protein
VIFVAQLDSTASSTLGGATRARVVDKNLTHNMCGNPNEVSPVVDITGFLTN